MRILLLSAYDDLESPILAQWAGGAFPEYDWAVLTLPVRYFSWRLQGNSQSWAFGEREILKRKCNLLTCASMIDLSALKDMVPELAKVPSVC